MTRKRDISDVLHAYDLIQKGASRNEAAKAIHASPSWLRVKLKSLGLFENMSVSSFDREAAVSDYLAGMSELAVAKKYGVARGTIRSELTKHGIKCRNGSEANYIRLGNMTPEQRQNLVAAAHQARQGSHDRHEVLVKKALIKETKTCFFGLCENELYDKLCAVGLKVVRQKACDIYNIDFAINGTVAVELTVGSVKFQGRCANQRKRIKKLIECGYTVITVTFKNTECFFTSANKLISDIQRICLDPTSSCKYWVIRGTFKQSMTIRLDNGKFTAIKMPIKFSYSLNEGKL